MQNLSDDDCDENKKFELPKITKLPSFTEYQKRSEVSLKNVRRFRLYKNTSYILQKRRSPFCVFGSEIHKADLQPKTLFQPRMPR